MQKYCKAELTNSPFHKSPNPFKIDNNWNFWNSSADVKTPKQALFKHFASFGESLKSNFKKTDLTGILFSKKLFYKMN